MRYVRFGSSGLEISTIGLGTWAFGGWMWGGQDDRESIAALHAAIDHGVNWVDTAPIYGSGRSEVVVGRAVGELPERKRPLIFTKFGLGADSAVNNRSATRREVVAECEASLTRLGVDRIDLYQLHWPTPTPVDETARACQDLLGAGKIRAVGVSNFSVAQLEEWVATGLPLHALQTPYSILRSLPRTDRLPWCETRGLGVICYSPLFRGLLFGTWDRKKTFPADDARSTHKDYQGARFQRHLDAVEELRALASARGLSCPQLCIGVLLATAGVSGCIVGARSAIQGARIASLGVDVGDDETMAVWQVVERLEADLVLL